MGLTRWTYSGVHITPRLKCRIKGNAGVIEFGIAIRAGEIKAVVAVGGIIQT